MTFEEELPGATVASILAKAKSMYEATAPGSVTNITEGAMFGQLAKIVEGLDAGTNKFRATNAEAAPAQGSIPADHQAGDLLLAKNGNIYELKLDTSQQLFYDSAGINLMGPSGRPVFFGYADAPDGTGFSVDPSGKKFIGIYVPGPEDVVPSGNTKDLYTGKWQPVFSNRNSGVQAGSILNMLKDYQKRTMTGETVTITTLENPYLGAVTRIAVTSNNKTITGTVTTIPGSNNITIVGGLAQTELVIGDIIEFNNTRFTVSGIISQTSVSLDQVIGYSGSGYALKKIDNIKFNIPNTTIQYSGGRLFYGGVLNIIRAEIVDIVPQVGATPAQYILDLSIDPNISL